MAVPDGRPSQATTLVHEADEQLLIDAALLTGAVRVLQPEAPLATAATTAAVAAEVPTPRQFGFAFGTRYADTLDDADLRALQREAPEVPAEVAAQLFREAEHVFGSTRGRPEMRRELRMGFWDHVMQRRNNQQPVRT